MKFNYRYALLYSTVLAIAGCGGGGGSNTTSTTSVSALSFNVQPEQPYFEKVEDAFFDPTKLFDFAYKGQEVANRGIVAYAADLDNDGKDELILLLSIQPLDVNVRSISKLVVVKLVGNKFEDVTDSFLNDTSPLPGNLSHASIVKFENSLAILVGDNEDRHPLWSGQVRVFLKTSNNKYSVFNIGNLGSGNVPQTYIDKNGVIHVTVASHNANPYRYTNGVFTAIGHQLPSLSIAGFKFFNTNNGIHSDSLLQTNANNLFVIEGYKLNANNSWELVESKEPFEKVTTENWLKQNNPVSVWKYDNKLYIPDRSSSAIGMMCQLKTVNNQESVLFHIPILPLVNYTQGQILNQNSVGKLTSKIAFTSIQNNKVEIKFPQITGEMPNANTRNYICKDVNKDGIDDIVIHPIVTATDFTEQINPIVYLGKSDGSYAKAKFPAIGYVFPKPNHVNQGSSVLGDFNGDGLQDFVLFGNDVGYGYAPPMDKTMQFYKANKNID